MSYTDVAGACNESLLIYKKLQALLLTQNSPDHGVPSNLPFSDNFPAMEQSQYTIWCDVTAPLHRNCRLYYLPWEENLWIWSLRRWRSQCVPVTWTIVIAELLNYHPCPPSLCSRVLHAQDHECSCWVTSVLALCKSWKEAFSSRLGVQGRISTLNERDLRFLTKTLGRTVLNSLHECKKTPDYHGDPSLAEDAKVPPLCRKIFFGA